MMQPDGLVKLAASGNTRTVEEEWMRVVESAETTLDGFPAYDIVLAELKQQGKSDVAQALTWTAIESITAAHEAREVLSVAGPFLLAVGGGDEIRTQVTKLYQTTFAAQEGLDALIEEAGIAGGRPVRRALRTLDVCLSVKEGDFLRSRDDMAAARIDTIDRADWQFEVTTDQGQEQFGAVHLADAYFRVPSDDFFVVRQFDRPEVERRLAKDPAWVVAALCKANGNKIQRDVLQTMLVTDLLSEAEWKKWWPRARTALKKLPNVQIEQRSPYTIELIDELVDPEHIHLSGFEKLHDPAKQVKTVEAYLQDCKTRKREPSESALKRCFEHLCDRATRLTRQGSQGAGLAWIAARRVGEGASLNGAADGAREFFKSATGLPAIFQEIHNDDLHELGLVTMVEARPDDWQDLAFTLLPASPMSACQRIAKRLRDAGRTGEEFEASVESILGLPVEHFDALAWLWDGPDPTLDIPERPLLTLLTRIFKAMDECRRSDSLSKECVKRITARTRSVLPARKYQRFIQCLDGVESTMASVLRTQIQRLDNLGRAAREDMLSRLTKKFPELTVKPLTPPWERKDVLYVTHAGLVRKQNEIDHHVNVTMKKNAEAIGHAAERGDLSENSEFKFALEERDLLRARLAQMNSEVAIAQILKEEDVPTDHIGIGSKAIFKRVSDDHIFEMKIVGPWEADLANGYYNYGAPLALRILGAKIGDTVEFDIDSATGSYTLASLSNALTEMA